MHAVAAKAVQVNRQGGGEGLTFTGRHFGNRAFMEHETTDHLHVEGHHAERLHRFRIEFTHLRVEGGGQVDFPFVLPAGEFRLRVVHHILEFGSEAAEVKAEFRLEDVENTESAVTGFLAHRKGVDLDVVESRTVFQFLAEFRALGGKRRIVQGFQRHADSMNLLNNRAKLLHLAFMGCTKNLMEDGIYYAHCIPL